MCSEVLWVIKTEESKELWLSDRIVTDAKFAKRKLTNLSSTLRNSWNPHG